MSLNYFTILTLLSVFLTSILALFFIVTKKGFSAENRILAALLVIFGFQIIYSFTLSYEYFIDWHKPIFLLRQTSFLIGPLIYFYVNSFLKRKDVFHYRNSFHFLPFVLVVLFLTNFYSHTSYFIICESILNLFDTILILTHNFIYIILSVWSMRSMNIGFSGFYKSIRVSSHNMWLQMLLLGFMLLWIVNLNSFAIYMIIRRPWWCAFTTSIYALIAFLFVNTIMFILLLKPDIYYIITKYKNNRLDEDDKREYLQRLNDYMETEKPFLNPEISLESLADEMSVNPRNLSQIINETYQKNFKGYVLEFRIKESMRLLADADYSELTVLEILYKVGFNSKSAFNNQFKLYTGLTPQEYRSKYMMERNSTQRLVLSMN